MIQFFLNQSLVETAEPGGVTVLDFVRYRRNLKGTKIGCREGDCGACTVLVGELDAGGSLRYRTQTACLMPLANAAGKHVVTVEGLNRADGSLTAAQAALVETSGTQCGFCTVGFVMSLTGFALDAGAKTRERAVAAIDGNICRCTGYKSIERACERLAGDYQTAAGDEDGIKRAIARGFVPAYFGEIKTRLEAIQHSKSFINPKSKTRNPKFLAGGTDLYVQRPEEMIGTEAAPLFDDARLRRIGETATHVALGASVVVTDLLEADVFRRLFPRLEPHLKLVSSTPIRNMATLAGNLVNASPIGDMTAWLLALDAEIVLENAADGASRTIPLRDFYRGYKTLAKTDAEFVALIRFPKNFTHFNFEKVSKRTYLDIASVNTAASFRAETSGGAPRIADAHLSAGGVAPVPLYLAQTSSFLRGRTVDAATVREAAAIAQAEISPISDVRGSVEYKRLLLRQLLTAHFAECFPDAIGD